MPHWCKWKHISLVKISARFDSEMRLMKVFKLIVLTIATILMIISTIMLPFTILGWLTVLFFVLALIVEFLKYFFETEEEQDA